MTAHSLPPYPFAASKMNVNSSNRSNLSSQKISEETLLRVRKCLTFSIEKNEEHNNILRWFSLTNRLKLVLFFHHIWDGYSIHDCPMSVFVIDAGFAGQWQMSHSVFKC